MIRSALLLLVPVFVLGLVAYAPDAHACACCSEPGDRTETVTTIDVFQKGEIDKVRFGKKARLFTTAAGVAGVQGITDPQDNYEISQTRNAATGWTFTLKDAKGRTGTLSFAMPTHLESFFIDQQDAKAPPGDPLLYKEWRLNAAVTGATGIFSPAKSSGTPTIRVVLQGRGNACTSADQFNAFTIVVAGPSARFTLFGQLAASAP